MCIIDFFLPLAQSLNLLIFLLWMLSCQNNLTHFPCLHSSFPLLYFHHCCCRCFYLHVFFVAPSFGQFPLECITVRWSIFLCESGFQELFVPSLTPGFSQVIFLSTYLSNHPYLQSNPCKSSPWFELVSMWISVTHEVLLFHLYRSLAEFSQFHTLSWSLSYVCIKKSCLYSHFHLKYLQILHSVLIFNFILVEPH